MNIKDDFCSNVRAFVLPKLSASQLSRLVYTNGFPNYQLTLSPLALLNPSYCKVAKS